MTTLIGSVLQKYHTLVSEDKYLDPRTREWYTASSPATFFMVLAGYIYFCTKLGPQLMEERKPFELKNTLLVYNIFQILFSCCLVYKGFNIWKRHDILCAPIDYTDMYEATGVWCYFVAKITELLDTVFFVLRKKNNQVSFLHLFHHTVMPFFSWFGVRYFAGGHSVMFGAINSFVHIIMYSYYLVASLGPEYQKYLWWKKHLTGLQLLQFGLIFIHNFIPLFTSCEYPKFLNMLSLIFAMFFIFMFGNFYFNNYIRKPKQTHVNKNGKLN